MVSRLGAAGGQGSARADACPREFIGFQALRQLKRALCLLMAVALSVLTIPAQAEEEFLDPAEAFVLSAAMANPTELHVHFQIAPDYYMYRDRFAFELDTAIAGEPIYPRGTVKYDPTFDEDMEVYHDQVTIRLPLQAGAQQAVPLRITGQGCANAGLCYPPMTFALQLMPADLGYRVQGEGVVESVPPPQDELARQGAATGSGRAEGVGGVLSLGDTGLASYLADIGWVELVGLAFLFGVLLTFTPCVLPMVPIVMAVVAGDARRHGPRGRWRGLGLAASYVLGMSLVYTVLGVAAGLVGASLAAWLQTPWVLSVFALLLALLALAMFDVYTFQAPARLQAGLSERASHIPGGRWGGALLIGMVSALIVGPCVAAPLAGVLLFISQTGDVALGGSALFAMAWGQGLLLLVLGATSGALIPRAGPWMDGVKQFFGMLLLATAWWMLRPVVPVWVAILGWAFLAMCSAVMLGAFGRRGGLPVSTGATGLWRSVLRAAGLLLAVWSILLLVGLAAGGRDLFRPLAPFAATNTLASESGGASPTARLPEFTPVESIVELDEIVAQSSQPVLLDFYADWCVSCIEMERFTFTDPQVAQRMNQFLLVQADVTANTPEHRELLRRFNLFGPPGIIFFDRDGAELSKRVIGFQNAERFGAVLDEVLQGAN